MFIALVIREMKELSLLWCERKTFWILKRAGLLNEIQPLLCKNQLRLAFARFLRAFRRKVLLSGEILNVGKKDHKSQKNVEEAAHKRAFDKLEGNVPMIRSPAEAGSE